MNKKSRKSKMKKTQVEQILGRNNIAYEQAGFPAHQDGDVHSMNANHAGVDEHIIYKTLVLTGNVIESLVDVIPADTHLDEKRLAKVSDNKKANVVPLKNPLKTTGYVHGANAPVGIYKKFEYPISIGNEAREQGDIFISSDRVSHSVKLNAEDLATLAHITFADLEQK